jgi:hypothetical protein
MGSSRARHSTRLRRKTGLPKSPSHSRHKPSRTFVPAALHHLIEAQRRQLDLALALLNAAIVADRNDCHSKRVALGDICEVAVGLIDGVINALDSLELSRAATNEGEVAA